MRLAGINVTYSASSRLALLLHQSGDKQLAFHLGLAIDHLRDEFTLTVRDRERRAGNAGEVSAPTHCPAWYPALTRIDALGGKNLRVRGRSLIRRYLCRTRRGKQA